MVIRVDGGPAVVGDIHECTSSSADQHSTPEPTPDFVEVFTRSFTQKSNKWDFYSALYPIEHRHERDPTFTSANSAGMDLDGYSGSGHNL
jgi:hypothetical protein